MLIPLFLLVTTSLPQKTKKSVLLFLSLMHLMIQRNPLRIACYRRKVTADAMGTAKLGDRSKENADGTGNGNGNKHSKDTAMYLGSGLS